MAHDACESCSSPPARWRRAPPPTWLATCSTTSHMPATQALPPNQLKSPTTCTLQLHGALCPSIGVIMLCFRVCCSGFAPRLLLAAQPPRRAAHLAAGGRREEMPPPCGSMSRPSETGAQREIAPAQVRKDAYPSMSVSPLPPPHAPGTVNVRDPCAEPRPGNPRHRAHGRHRRSAACSIVPVLDLLHYAMHRLFHAYRETNP